MVIGNSKLTAKMEHYALLLFQGYNQAEAKCLAYPKCNLIGNAHYVNASRLANLGKIRLRVDELRNAAVTPIIADIIERKEHATNVMRNSKISARDQLAANKLIGDYEQDFVQRTESKNLNVNADANVLKDATMEELKAMLAEIREKKRKALLNGAGQVDETTAPRSSPNPT